MPEFTSKPEHEATFQDLIGLIKKHDLTPPEMLAVAANLVGKLIAMQDQRTMSQGLAMRIVGKNIEIGNQQVMDGLRDTKGNA